MEKLLPVLYHNYTETVKRKHVFVAPREAGYWKLWDSFDARENVLSEVERAKAQGFMVEVVVTDDDADSVAAMLHKKAAAFHRAGLGPDRTPPFLTRPVPVHVAAARAATADRRRRKKKKTLSLPERVLPCLPERVLPLPVATPGPSQPDHQGASPAEEIPSAKDQQGSGHDGPQHGPSGHPADEQTPSLTFDGEGTRDQQDR